MHIYAKYSSFEIKPGKLAMAKKMNHNPMTIHYFRVGEENILVGV